METLVRLKNILAKLDDGDYDNRTPMHLAAANGNLEIIKFLVEKCGCRTDVKDRWGVTPLGDAKTEEIKAYLSKEEIKLERMMSQIYDPVQVNITDESFRLFYSAYYANLDYIKSLLIEGDINAYDYDGRTALGIAASEGHKDIVEYLVYHGANINHTDARGNDAYADAIREGRKEVIPFLEEFKKNSA